MATYSPETDIVIFNRGYPVALRQREEILAGGVAAAFSAKLTLDAAGLRDGVERAARLRRHLEVRSTSAREEILAPFPVGLIAHSHIWKSPGSKPIDNISEALIRWDEEHAKHPRETIDLVCVADLATWSTARMPYFPPAVAQRLSNTTARQRSYGGCVTAIQLHVPELPPPPVGVFITQLLRRLSYPIQLFAR